MRKLWIVHLGFYPQNSPFEQHDNILVISDSAADARKLAKMKFRRLASDPGIEVHVDGCIEVSKVDGYDIVIEGSFQDLDDEMIVHKAPGWVQTP